MGKSEPAKRICFFDSGIGGLNLLNECVRKRPDCDYYYFADNFNVPYGTLSHEEIIGLVDGFFTLISRLSPTAAVVACNTVTAECISFLRSKYLFPIIGIQPAVKPAALVDGKCLVLSTPATAQSAAIKSLVQKYGRGKTTVVPCIGLADYIENNIYNIENEKVNSLLPDFKVDSVVLGCTHYAYVSEIIKERYKCPIFDGIEGTANNFSKIIGISDHRNIGQRKITFMGGNSPKNLHIFNYLRLKQ